MLPHSTLRSAMEVGPRIALISRTKAFIVDSTKLGLTSAAMRGAITAEQKAASMPFCTEVIVHVPEDRHHEDSSC